MTSLTSSPGGSVRGIAALGTALLLSALMVSQPAAAQDFGGFSAPPPESRPKPAPPPPAPKPREQKSEAPKPKPRPVESRPPRAPPRMEERLSWISGRRICQGSGQVCAQGATWPLITETADNFFLIVAVPPDYCSPFRLGISVDRQSLGETGLLQPGVEEVYRLGWLAPGSHQLQVSATGAPGGCNQGTLEQWGVDLELSNRPALGASARGLSGEGAATEAAEPPPAVPAQGWEGISR